MQEKLYILGSKGMLGQMVRAYFEKEGFDITCHDERFDQANREQYSRFLRSIRSGYVVNCIGKIKQKTNDAGDLLYTNSILPAELRNALHQDIVLVHPSTDCVFNGKLGSNYPTTHIADAEDDYGWSKRLGEVALEGRLNTLVPRVSIIGPDNNKSGKGLLSWVKSNPAGSSVNGFTNHLWNGITTLEWCKQVHRFITKNENFHFRLVQFGTSEHYNKYEMLVLFNKIFDLKLNIVPVNTPDSIDRRLVADIVCKPLPEQLAELESY